MGQKGWLMFNLETEKAFVSQNVVFHEDKFPFSENIHLLLLYPSQLHHTPQYVTMMMLLSWTNLNKGGETPTPVSMTTNDTVAEE